MVHFIYTNTIFYKKNLYHCIFYPYLFALKSKKSHTYFKDNDDKT